MNNEKSKNPFIISASVKEAEMMNGKRRRRRRRRGGGAVAAGDHSSDSGTEILLRE